MDKKIDDLQTLTETKLNEILNQLPKKHKNMIFKIFEGKMKNYNNPNLYFKIENINIKITKKKIKISFIVEFDRNKFSEDVFWDYWIIHLNNDNNYKYSKIKKFYPSKQYKLEAISLNLKKYEITGVLEDFTVEKGGLNFDNDCNLWKSIDTVSEKSKLSEKFDNESLRDITLINGFEYNNIDFFKDIRTFFHYNGTKIEKFIGKIDLLILSLFFYESGITNNRITIIEDGKNFKLIFKDYWKKEAKNKLFEQDIDNMFDFIKSSFSNFEKLNNGFKKNKKNGKVFDVNHLVRSYIFARKEELYNTKFILLLVFLEFLTTNCFSYQHHKYNSSKHKHLKDKKIKKRGKSGDFSIELNKIMTWLKLDTEKLLKKIDKTVYNKLDEIEIKLLKENNYDKNLIKDIFYYFKSEYFLKSIVKYRNQMIHEGKLKFDFKDPENILGSIYNVLGNNNYFALLNNASTTFKEIFKSEIKDNFNDLNYEKGHPLGVKKLDDEILLRDLVLIHQTDILNEFIEVILLSIFKVDCRLKREGKFKDIDNIWSIRNSKKYANQFLKET